MPNSSDDHPPLSSDQPDDAVAPLRARKPWRAPVVISATGVEHADKVYSPYDLAPSQRFGPTS
jgi:hypothetical protein